MEELVNSIFEEKLEKSLFVRNVPQVLNEEEITRFFGLFGALRHVRQYGGAYVVEFSNFAEAEAARMALEGREVMGSVLRADFHRKRRRGRHTPIYTTEVIRERLGYAPSPLLEYDYPPPDAQILANISRELSHNDQFYTQVLHLMNKMCLPCPFFDQRVDTPAEATVSSSESEKRAVEPFESSTFSTSTSAKAATLPLRIEELNSDRDRVFFSLDAAESCLGNETAHRVTSVLGEAVSEQSKPALPLVDISERTQEEDMEEISREGEQEVAESALGRHCISLDFLEQNRLTKSEMDELKVFKGYSRGERNSCIYIKNIHKKVTEAELKFVFGAFFQTDEASERELSVKLFKKGRMHGQAYVEFPEVDQAECAVNTVNGFVLHGKPLVISYRRL